MPDPNPEDKKPKPTGNATVDANMTEVLADRERLRTRLGEVETELKTTRDSLKIANDLLDAQTKAALIEEIRTKSDFGIEELSDMTCDELRNTRNHINRIKQPVLSSGDLGGKTTKKGLDDLYGVGWKK